MGPQIQLFMHRVAGPCLCAFALLTFMGIVGCQSSTSGPAVLQVASAQYAAAFDAAEEVANRHGLTGGLRDRRAGILETDTRIAGSVLEPWRIDNASNKQAFENTLNFQRRRARFEFTPVGFQPVDAPDQLLSGPQLLNEQPTPDLTKSASDLELRVWVFVERSQAVGVRRSTWSRTKTTVSRVIDPDTGEAAANSWIAVRRDVDYEQRLMGEISAMLDAGSHAPSN